MSAPKKFLPDNMHPQFPSVARLNPTDLATSLALRSHPSLLSGNWSTFNMMTSGEKIRATAALAALEVSYTFGNCAWHEFPGAYVSEIEDVTFWSQDLDGYQVTCRPNFLIVPALSRVSSQNWTPAQFYEIQEIHYLWEQYQLAAKRYVYDWSAGNWRSPVGEMIAGRDFGFGYRVITKSAFDRILGQSTARGQLRRHSK